jgi:thymidine kinase
MNAPFAYETTRTDTVCEECNWQGNRTAYLSHNCGPTCTATQNVPVGYDETVYAECNSIRGHAGAHTWIEA